MGREEHEEGNEVLTVSEVFWAILSAHIQPSASEPIGQRYAVHVDSDPKQPEYFFSTCWGQNWREMEEQQRLGVGNECLILNTAQFFHSSRQKT